MPDGVSRSSNMSSNALELASHEPEDTCQEPAGSTGSPAPSAAPSGGDSWATSTTPYLPADHPASGVQLHKFRATGDVSWACVSDCVSSQGITGAGFAGGEAVAMTIGTRVGGIAALVTAATVTPLACYFACSDLQGLPPPKNQLEPVEVPDASVYSVAVP